MSESLLAMQIAQMTHQFSNYYNHQSYNFNNILIVMMQILRPCKNILHKNTYLFGSRIPTFTGQYSQNTNTVHILHEAEAPNIVPSHKTKQFTEKNHVTSVSLIKRGPNTTEVSNAYYNQKTWSKVKISTNTSISFSEKIRKAKNFLGIASQVLIKGYSFSRKQKD